MAEPSPEFRNYAWQSVRVDQYYAAVRIFARSHQSLAAAHQRIPTDLSSSTLANADESIRNFVASSAFALRDMAAKGIFITAPYPELRNRAEDMLTYAFRTSFCFQWSLFESFVISCVLQAAADGLLNKKVTKELRGLERRTERFLKYLDTGNVFPSSPFQAILPKPTVDAFSVDEFRYAELDNIRMCRNALVHAMGEAPVRSDAHLSDEDYYERSMWVLRKFAEGIEFAVGRLRGRY